jgi:hypothetical protein
MTNDLNNAYDCEVFFRQMESMDRSETSWDMEDDDFYEFDEMEQKDHLDTAFSVIPNVIAAVASVTRNLEAKRPMSNTNMENPWSSCGQTSRGYLPTESRQR